MSEPSAQHTERTRLLALMGVDVYVRRDRATSVATRAAEQVAEAGLGYAAQPSDSPAPKPAPARVAAKRSASPRVVFALPADAGEGFDGVHGPLLRNLAAALGLSEAQVAFDDQRTQLPWICFRAPPAEVANAVLAPPLGTLRADAASKRALWRSLKPLFRQLRG